MEPKVEFAMQTPDGVWRIEIIKRGRTQWYRIIHDDNVLDWLSIAAVQRLLGEAGVDMADLAEIHAVAPTKDESQHGVA